jgi:hypothetical protein
MPSTVTRSEARGGDREEFNEHASTAYRMKARAVKMIV